MQTVTEHIKARRSVRTFDGRAVEEEMKERLLSFARTIRNPFAIPVAFKLLDAKANGLTCPVVSGTNLYIGGKLQAGPDANVAFGFSFETLVLYAQSLGLGTVWLGGTMNRAAFEQAMALTEGEIMPCASPLGYAAPKLSMREAMMRKAIRADDRLPFEQLFFNDSFDTPLTRDAAGVFAEPLDMVRLAPSAVNKQPWRAVVRDRTVHVYLKRSHGFNRDGALDMQQIDIGIALCHLALTAQEHGLDLLFTREDPLLPSASALTYIASYTLR